MEIVEFFNALINANNVSDAETALSNFQEGQESKITWEPVGKKENNRGPIEVNVDQGRSIIERVTNGVDAILELEHDQHGGVPDCKSPVEAARAWLNVPNEGLSAMSQVERRKLAQNLTVKLMAGDGKESAIVEVRDKGLGISQDGMPNTILSLNEGNKIKKHYLCGVYGQGGSSTFVLSKYTLIASRSYNENKVAFTVVKYLDLPPEDFKTGHYVYLAFDKKVLVFDLDKPEQFEVGTLVRHIGYEISKYYQPVGPHSLYGLLNTVLFDPIIPVWLDNRVNDYRRVIKGSRNALNGAIDETDEQRTGVQLSHKMPIFYANIPDFGRIGIEYWVLKSVKGQQPTAAFVNPIKPIILTLNGQNHAELSRILIKQNAELPYLTSRLIVHIDCNSLTPEGKRLLIPSTRETAREGVVRTLIEKEIINALKSDDTLTKLNEEAMQSQMFERDEEEYKSMRQEVAKILRLQGIKVMDDLSNMIGTEGEVGTGGANIGGRKTPTPITIAEPPTYIKILWENPPITFYPEQRRYIRIETDANASYHDANDPTKSKINIIANNLKIYGTTPLQNGRMRIIAGCEKETAVGTTGNIRIELSRTGLATLSDDKAIKIVERPPIRQKSKALTLPEFEIKPIGPDDEIWTDLGWPEEINSVASEAVMNQGKLIIYYSKVFPQYANKREIFERKKQSIALTFTKKYELWLVVHSLLFEQDKDEKQTTAEQEQQEQQEQKKDEEGKEAFERKERCRVAVIASLVAAKETEQEGDTVESNANTSDD